MPNKCTGEVIATVPLADVAVTHEAIAAAARAFETYKKVPAHARSSTLIEPDADLAKAAERCVVSAFVNAGQVCISLQRIYMHRDCAEAFTRVFVEKVKALKVGDPLDPACEVGPMIDRQEIQRIDAWVREAVAGVMINDTPTFRLDHFPYGGNKRSGLGREGVRFAMEDMTTIKMVVINHN